MHHWFYLGLSHSAEVEYSSVCVKLIKTVCTVGVIMEGVNADGREQQHSQRCEEELKPAVSAEKNDCPPITVRLL